ncbi:MAG TPA: MBL fold metallo-hydrolase [Nitrolancea sp.]|jgi:ribonuclease BN (tRNA processing enzyme)|nr:MBL fold metallo-hydrolase [Nitrolancea sp.]
MKLTVIGGSASCPNPGGACSSFLVTHGGFSVLLDCGPDSISVLRQHATLRDIGAVLISHLHSDHTLDLVPFRYGLRYIPGGRGSRVPLWLPPGGEEFLERLGTVFALGAEFEQPFFSTEFDVAEFNPDARLDVGPFQVEFMPTHHFVACWAMRLHAGGRQLVYLADSGFIEPLIDFAHGADVVICEATLPSEATGMAENSGHLTAAQAGEIAERAGAGHLLLTHLWAENDLQTVANEARSTFSGAITIAESGVQLVV